MNKIDRLRKLVLIFSILLPLVYASSIHADEELWNALKDGGKVVLIRHAPVERGPNTGNSLVRDPSCVKEKNLSVQGKQDAKTLAERFEQYGVPVSAVRHSPFCRTTETAAIAFGDAKPADYLSLLEVLGPDEAKQQTETLTEVIASHEGEGNLVLVSHEPNIRAVSFELVKYLDILVLEPQGDGEFEELGVISFSETE